MSESSLRYLNELLEETLACAEESGATDSLESFKTFVEDMIPGDVLDLLNDEANATLEDIWQGRYAPDPAVDEGDGADASDGCCEMCEREMRLTKHHLIPREMHERIARQLGTPKDILNKVSLLCRMCHSTVHRFFTNKELAYDYNSLELLLADERVYKYAKWASTMTDRGNMRVHR
jgi:hypothetical protein